MYSPGLPWADRGHLNGCSVQPGTARTLLSGGHNRRFVAGATPLCPCTCQSCMVSKLCTRRLTVFRGTYHRLQGPGCPADFYSHPTAGTVSLQCGPKATGAAVSRPFPGGPACAPSLPGSCHHVAMLLTAGCLWLLLSFILRPSEVASHGRGAAPTQHRLLQGRELLVYSLSTAPLPSRGGLHLCAFVGGEPRCQAGSCFSVCRTSPFPL